MLRLMILFAYPSLASVLKDGNTKVEDHPYILSLELDYVHRCSASLIAPNLALTSALCTFGKNASNFTIRAGSTYLNIGGGVTNVIKICEHPKYNDLTQDYDVSVLALSRSLLLSAKIQPIELQPARLDVLSGTCGVVASWELFGIQGSNLKRVSVSKITDNTCKQAYSTQKITDRMTCYVTDGEKCTSDFGGPLVVYNKQVGIVSWGTESICGNVHYPGVYTKISNEEIYNHIRKCIPD